MEINRFESQARYLARASRRNLLHAGTRGLLACAFFTSVADVAALARKTKRPASQRQASDRIHPERGKKRKRKHRHPVALPPPSASPLPPSGPTTHADATCPGPSDDGSATGGNARLAQSFMALTSGPLVSAELPIFKDVNSLGDYIRRLSPVDSTGVPTNVELASAVAANVHVPVGNSTDTFTFATPFSDVAGTEYALVLTRSSQFQWNGRNGDPCPGRTFYSPDQTSGFTESSVFPDLIFTTYVRS